MVVGKDLNEIAHGKNLAKYLVLSVICFLKMSRGDRTLSMLSDLSQGQA